MAEDATYRFTDRDGDVLKVEHSTANRGQEAYVVAGHGAYVPPAAAVALAIAVLETSGATDAGATSSAGEASMARSAVRYLRNAQRHAQRLADAEARRAKAAAERKAKEEAEQADAEKLDAEAWALYKAHWGMTGSVPDGWVVASPGQAQERDRWRKVARAAREALVPQDSAPDLPRFAVVRATKQNGIREFGVLDRNSGDVATFGGLSNAQHALDQVAAAPTRWIWTPAASITHTEEIN
ncbi:hypothetical protein [Arthrobacter phage SWEP2]|uniref:Uncharacterized protein n=1 Tax=Arthrobacter phage SWEP2 TaxID=2945958 RepID=A0A9E7MIY6_9CAUD|nr:hypothetical protein [Arthrobacter phage SWEP2]